MSEVQTRPPAPRGRGSSRGGRGGFSARPARASHANGGSNASYDTFDDQGEIGQLKRPYVDELSQLQELFSDWTPDDLVTALDENGGDVQVTAEKISEGTTTQWGKVEKKSKDRSRSKVKEPSSVGANIDPYPPSSRPRGGGRASHESGRGPRGSRGGSEFRASRGGRSRGRSRKSSDRAEEAPTSAEGCGGYANTKATSLDDKKAADYAFSAWPEEANKETEANGASENFYAPDIHSEASKSNPDQATLPVPKPAPATSWASKLFSKPPPPPPASVQKIPSPPKQPAVQPEPAQPSVPEYQEPEPVEESLPPPKEASPEVQPAPATPEPVEPTPEPVEPEPVPGPEEEAAPEIPEAKPSPVQPLTEVNLERIEDTAPPPPTMTQASTIASSAPTPAAPVSLSAPPPPPPPPPPQHAVTTPQPAPSRPVHSGVVMPKGTPGRSSGYNRRILDQQEGVVMPGNHGAVEHATLQFGSMGLNGDIDDEEEVEQAETVSQPPQPSPIAQPVTSLPPTGPSQLPIPQPPVTETLPTPRQAPGLPVHPQAAPQQPSPQPPAAPQSMTQQQPHQLNSQLPSHYNRYAVPETQTQTKSFDTFAHSAQQQSIPPHQPQAQPQAYGNYAPSPLQHQQPQPSHIGVGVSAAPDQQQQYNYYNDRSQPPGFGAPYTSNYMQQAQSQQDAGANQQRASSGLGGGAGEGLGQVPTSAGTAGQVQQSTSRYPAQTGEQGSGHATPSPAIPTVQQTSQPHQPIGQHPTQAFQYGYQQHPYYGQFIPGSYYGQQFKNHQGMYAYPQAYMSPQYSDHASTPTGLGGFGAPSAQGRDGVAGLGDYNRMNTTAAQQQQQQQQALPQHTSAGGYGSGVPNFLSSRGLPQEQQQLGAGVGQQQAGQQGPTDESLKFGENKPPTGPSGTPSIPGQPGRPGSATSNLGPQHGGQTPASMYGSHLNHGLHGHQAQSQYGAGQGQSGTNQYSMYSGGYPQYGQTSGGRHGGGGWGGYGH
ncbi:unnamed protein product [Tuber aestivum]|uniref:RNA polymerase II degradation factor 1 n=1 Tax=Tuber aestivum TaxID=59557 RepID=A0A292Q5X1_9PEZI|nr:unnamed protein product [Tuber aestivum]